MATIDEGRSFGPEMMGTFEKEGDGVENFEAGDQVVLPFNVPCGHCENGDTSACLNVESETPGGAYGYAQMGLYRGGQAEKIRVAYAESNRSNPPRVTKVLLKP